jgi:hypothetical protein
MCANGARDAGVVTAQQKEASFNMDEVMEKLS